MEQVTSAIGNPTALLVERIFWLGLGAFLGLAIITSLLKGLKEGKDKTTAVSPDQLENLAKKAIQQNSDSNWYWLSDIFIATNKFTYGRWGENRTINYHWLDDEHICLIHIHKNNEISSLHIHGCCYLLRSFNNCYDSYYLIESHKLSIQT